VTFTSLKLCRQVKIALQDENAKAYRNGNIN